MRQLALHALLGLLVLSLGCETTETSGLNYGDVEKGDDGDGFKADSEFYSTNAQRFYDSGDYHRALNQFRKQLELEPGETGALLGEAYSLHFIGRNLAARGRLDHAAATFAEAEEKLEALWDGELEPDAAEGRGFGWKACLGLAMNERAQASLEKVRIDRLDAMLERAADGATVDELRGRQTGHERQRALLYRKSRGKLLQLTAMANAAPESWRNLGDVELILGNEPSAEKAYLQYLEIAKRSIDRWEGFRKTAPDEFASKHDLAIAMQAINQKEKAATRKTVGVLEQLAEIKFRRGNYETSLQYLLQALELDSSRYQLNVPVAECYYELGNYEKGLEYVDRYISATPGFDDDTRKAYKLRSKFLKHVEAKAGE